MKELDDREEITSTSYVAVLRADKNLAEIYSPWFSAAVQVLPIMFTLHI
jgi:hypothetical protein